LIVLKQTISFYGILLLLEVSFSHNYQLWKAVQIKLLHLFHC